MTNTNVVVDMDELLEGSQELILPEPGTIIEGVVVSIDKSRVILEVQGNLTGIIAGREMRDAMNTMETLQEGETVSACVLESENDEGLLVLSLRRASQEKTWDKFNKAFEQEEVIEVYPKEANKGGLLLDVDGIKGFIPVSQLAPMNYPRVNGADAGKILSRLEMLVGKKFQVKIISIDKEHGKLILSERAAYADSRNEALGQLKAGDIVQGQISGIVKFGIFVAFDGLEGLVHISEIAWGHVTNPHDFGKRGDQVKVKIIGIEGDKISLSMKQLTKDPWDGIEERYKVGSSITAKISRLAQFGAFVQLGDDINGLIHSSEIPGGATDPADALEVGQTVKARVLEINKQEKRIGLTLMPETKVAKAEEAEEVGDAEEAAKKKPAKKKKKEAEEKEEA